jgi:hypothetical protein
MGRNAVATDNFDRADNASLGANWTNLNADYGYPQVYSNQVCGSAVWDPSVQQIAARWNGTGTFSDNQYGSIKIGGLNYLSGSYVIGVICRASADSNATRDYYGFCVQANAAASPYPSLLFKVNNGTYAALNSGTVAWANNDSLSLEVEGNQVRACKNGAPLGGNWTVADNSLTTGKPGIVCMAAGEHQPIGDDWEGGDIVAAAATLEQEGFRWRNDDGNETTATWKDAQDANISNPAGQNVRLRVIINASGDPTTKQFQLEGQLSGDSNWVKI